MKSSRLSVTTFVLLGLICVINGNLITNIFGKSDDNAETDDKAAATTTSTAKPAEGAAAAAAPAAPAPAAPAVAPAAAPAAAAAGTTSTVDPGSSCGGLKGFLHLCDKGEPTEPPKNVKTRSVDDDDDDNDDSSSSSEENSHELKELRKKKQTEEKEDDDDDDDDDDNDEVNNQEEQSSTNGPTSTTEGQKVKKRQADVEDEEEEEDEEEPRTEKLDDYPFESPVFSMLKKRSVEEVKDEESKPMNATEAAADTQEEEVRRRRDCGDGGKDCRRKRELVPCVEPRCGRRTQEVENE